MGYHGFRVLSSCHAQLWGCSAGYTGVERWLLGWDEPVEINAPQSVELPALQSSGKSLRISTEHPDEFFILENRQQTGYDRFIPSHGLLIWHVDRRPEANLHVTIAGEGMDISCADAWTLDYNAVNSNAAHQCLEIEKASGNDGSKSSLDTPFLVVSCAHRLPMRPIPPCGRGTVLPPVSR